MVETSPRGDRRRRNRMPEIHRSQANNSNMRSKKRLNDSPSAKKLSVDFKTEHPGAAIHRLNKSLHMR